MSATAIRFIERAIAERLVGGLLAAGHAVTVYNDRNEPTPELANSTDRDAILAAMWSSDEDVLTIGDKANGKGENDGWVWCIHGNGEDMISDYTTNLESVVGPIYAWINEGCPTVDEPVEIDQVELQLRRDGTDWKWKINEGAWSPPYNTHREAYLSLAKEAGWIK